MTTVPAGDLIPGIHLQNLEEGETALLALKESLPLISMIGQQV